jgi:hypothetical protein
MLAFSIHVYEWNPRWFSLKGAGFSPYVKCTIMNLGFSP